MYRFCITLGFPFGANFYSSPHLLAYRSFLKMVKRLSCMNVENKCIDCPFQVDCQYYQITGKNFHGYPGILFEQVPFDKTLYKENETCDFQVYLVGNSVKYKAYIEVFFQEYLQYRLATFPFQIKKIETEDISEGQFTTDWIHINTPIESEDFQTCFNEMVTYYNLNYNTKYPLLHSALKQNKTKSIRTQIVKLPTKHVKVSGYVFNVFGQIKLSRDFLWIGIGKYNFIGGGKIAIKN